MAEDAPVPARLPVPRNPMESSQIICPGIYWHFDPGYLRSPHLVQLVKLEGALFIRSRRGLELLEGLAGDFAGPLPPDVPVTRRDPVTTWY